jgi:molybdopterin-synthase adenylyltransferase
MSKRFFFACSQTVRLEDSVTGNQGQQSSREIPSRYSRQVLFDGIGQEGQARLMASRVALVGCGALGALQASLLVRAGVGMLRIIDRDFVEESNLQRQILFDEEDVRDVLPKAAAAEKKLRAVNSLVSVEGVVEDLNASNIAALLDGFDLIADGTDNFEARYLINDYAVKTGTPWVYGACVGAYGLTFPILPGETACLRCIFESAPAPGISPTCDTAGIIAAIAGATASLQVAEALKILAGKRDRIQRRITVLDLWSNRHELINLPPRDPDCPCCGRRTFPYLEGTIGSEAGTLCGRNAVQIRRRGGAPVDLEELARRLAGLETLEKNRFLVRAFVDNCELVVFADGRAIVRGTSDLALARSLYARYIGT